MNTKEKKGVVCMNAVLNALQGFINKNKHPLDLLDYI